MSVEIKVPVLGESLNVATVAQWLRKPGDWVERGETVLEIETDKVSMDVSAPASGRLGPEHVPAGTEVPEGAVLGSVVTVDDGAEPPPAQAGADEGAAREQAPPVAAEGAEAESPASTSQSPSDQDNPLAAVDMLVHSARAAVREVQEAYGQKEAGSDQGEESPAGVRMVFQDQPVANQASQPMQSTQPTQPSGRAPGAPTSASAPPITPLAGGERRRPMSRLRQTIASNLKQAQNTAAILTTFNEVDMGAVKELRTKYKEKFEKRHDVRLGFMSFFARAVTVALEEFPALNARIDEKGTNGQGPEIVENAHVNLGIAVGTPRGLVVPVIRQAEKMDFAQLEKAVGLYGRKAKDNALALSDLTGGTFTITNGGVFGSLLSTPILNAPQSGVLGMHSIQERPVARNGQVVIRPMMYVALSYDHRLVDGREAVSFLVRVKEMIEDPARLLLGL
ncbi:2-oxoglutarate dehydrogenase complex dihydrolipoyllysine-residue succinyltransferase [Formicincola oecophyllae]|uniref:Dihydrolipoyllysine-residue succinyltransferase n=1 Tax=Formicincola oecophyllae TaxID=2558361 RepID=A0A4Y6UD88_9PROT|nr:2-oxoglutarate dehydrogenase complex dihydrolipoyllysine-residue succinyltransferase [Formicincola oecophyllae]QDH14361.1 2-oxoglutarate dehydrogenase complex dihydrolipoyllysine-residue succinyltransferase [Formicincola oecophyllae]